MPIFKFFDMETTNNHGESGRSAGNDQNQQSGRGNENPQSSVESDNKVSRNESQTKDGSMESNDDIENATESGTR